MYFFSLSIHDKGGFITNLYRTYINGVLGERNAINRIKNSFPRVHMKTYSQTHKLTGQQEKMKLL